MERLSLQTFLSAGPDLESNQYQILSRLKSYHDEFSHNRLYPALSELIDLVHSLESLLQEQEQINQRLPQELKQIDLKNKRLVFEPAHHDFPGLERVLTLIRWALPRIREMISEGMEIFDFVEENVSIEEVGLMPMYKDEGYYFIPDNRASLLHLLRYETSLFTSGNEKYRTLKTTTVDSLEQSSIRRSPESIKLELIEHHQDLPNPATFLCETTLDFPYAETILPIAKRKLMARLYS